MSSDRVRVTEDVELGSYGAKWRHGWIPLNAAATALKAKRLKAGDKNHHAAEHHGGFTHIVAHSGSGTVHDSLIIGPDGKGHHAQFPTRAAAIADGAEHVATLTRTKEQIATTHGDKKLVAHELSNTGKGEIRTEDGKIVSSNHVSKLAATKIVNAHNARIEAPKPKRITDEEAAQLFHPRTKEQLAKTHGDTNLVAHELSNSGRGEIRTEDGKIVSSNHVSKLAATKIVNAHNAGVRRRKFETKVDKAPSRR